MYDEFARLKCTLYIVDNEINALGPITGRLRSLQLFKCDCYWV